MQEIKRIKPISAAKILGLFGVLIGFVMAIAIFILKSVFPEIVADIMATYGSSITTSSIATMPLSYGVSYFLVGFIGAAFYNIFVKWTGGISVELAQPAKPAKKR